MSNAARDFLDPKHREEATLIIAAVALHGLLSGGVPPGGTDMHAVDSAFSIARRFLAAAAEALKP